MGVTGGDFLDGILSNPSLSYDEKISIVLDLLLAGYETTATLMALIVYFLGHAPNALEKLKVSLSLSTCCKNTTCAMLKRSLLNIYAGRTPRDKEMQGGRGNLELGRL